MESKRGTNETKCVFSHIHLTSRRSLRVKTYCRWISIRRGPNPFLCPTYTHSMTTQLMQLSTDKSTDCLYYPSVSLKESGKLMFISYMSSKIIEPINYKRKQKAVEWKVKCAQSAVNWKKEYWLQWNEPVTNDSDEKITTKNDVAYFRAFAKCGKASFVSRYRRKHCANRNQAGSIATIGRIR